MLVWPNIAEVDSCGKEDEPERQQHKQAVTNGHYALVIPVAACIWLSSCLGIIQVVAVAVRNKPGSGTLSSNIIKNRHCACNNLANKCSNLQQNAATTVYNLTKMATVFVYLQLIVYRHCHELC